MSVVHIGKQFNIQDQWGPQEDRLVKQVTNQINQRFPDHKNLLITLTWFGPQFNNGAYQQIQEFKQNNTTFDHVFWLSSVDPIYMLPHQITEVENTLGVNQAFYLVGFEQSKHYVTFSAVATAEDFVEYAEHALVLTNPEYLFLCYNRKPKPHRIEIVEKICSNNLDKLGIVTLGKNDVNYDVSNGVKTDLYLTVPENTQDYSYNNRFLVHSNFGGVPYDLLSLGRMDIWDRHFLNIVSETEFLPWDNMFITEKTWKPILGLRPFVINGQLKIYKYLRDNGFRTFTHCFNGIELEDLAEYQVQDSIIKVLQYLQSLSREQIQHMYNAMLPDLLHNRRRFYEFAQEQKHKLDHLLELE